MSTLVKIQDKNGTPIDETNPLAVQVTGSKTGHQTSDTITRPNNTTAYSALDVVSTAAGEILEFDTGLDAGSVGVILGSLLKVAVNAVPSGCTGYYLHLYNAAPTVIADNAAYNLPATDLAKYLGYVIISQPIDLGDNIVSVDDGINHTFKLATGDTKLYGILQTIGAYTPTAQAIKTMLLNVAEV